MKLVLLLGLFGAAALALSLPAVQAGKDDPPEVNVVLRISRTLVNEITTQKVERTTPICTTFMDVQVRGRAHTRGTATLQFDTGPKANGFTVELRGTSLSETIGERPPVEVFVSGRLDFFLRKRVTFDGEKFRTLPTVADAQFTSNVDGIATPPGLLGVVIRIIATSKVRRQQPLADAMALEEGKAQVIAAFDEEINKKIDELNGVSPLEETINRLFPQTKNWIYYPEVTPTHLIVGAGPPGSVLPVLPTSEKTDAPIELWIRNKPGTPGMLAVLKLWREAGKQLQEMLPPELSKKINLEGGFDTQTVKDWFVIQLGKPAKGGLKEEPSGAGSMIVTLDPARPLFAQDRHVLPPAAVPEEFTWRAVQKTAPVEQTTIPWRPANLKEGP